MNRRALVLLCSLLPGLIDCTGGATPKPIAPSSEPSPPVVTRVVAEIPNPPTVVKLKRSPTPEPSLTAELTPAKSAAMPTGASFTGVYYNPVFGYLHLQQEQGTISGRWQRPQKGRWGQLSGKAQDNLLRFDWQEHTIGVVGPAGTKRGRGYFVYERPDGDNTDDTLTGEIGLGEDEVGSPWQAIKQRDTMPNLKAIGQPAASGGGDWE